MVILTLRSCTNELEERIPVRPFVEGRLEKHRRLIFQRAPLQLGQLLESLKAVLVEFDQKAFKDGAISSKNKELIALGIAQITQCPWCIQAHTKKAAVAGASDEEIAETTFVAMAMAAGAAWSHGGLALQCLEEHKG